jgi:hypothetical protein
MSIPPLLLAMGRRCDMDVTREGDGVMVEMREAGATLCRFKMSPEEADIFSGHLLATATEIINDQRARGAAA